MYKKNILTILLAIYLTAAWANLAFAQTQNAYENAGVGEQIKTFLCAPSDPPASQPSTDPSMVTYRTENNTAQNDLYNCINRLYRFAIVIASVFGVFFIVIGGYIYMSAEGSQESVDKAKSILISTITSLVILFGGYVLLKAIDPDLIKFKSIQPTNIKLQSAEAPGEGGIDTTAAPQQLSGNAQDLAKQILNKSSKISLAQAHASGKTDDAYAKLNIEQTANGQLAKRSSYKHGSLQAPDGAVALDANMLQAILTLSDKYSFSVSEIAGGAHSANSDHYTGRAFDVNIINGKAVSSSNTDYKSFMAECTRLGARLVLGPGDTGHGSHVHCSWAASGQRATSNSNLNYCQASTNYNCNETGVAAKCNSYNSYIQQYGSGISISGVNGAALLKAIMYHESKCRPEAVSNNGSSYGLMQMQIRTAQTFASSCNITENIDGNWFKNNPQKSICLAAEYLKSISRGVCGSELKNILAGYSNGEAGACTKNSNCANQACASGDARNWHCTSSTSQARTAVPEILKCINEFGATSATPPPTPPSGLSFLKPWNGPEVYPNGDFGTSDPNITSDIQNKLNELKQAYEFFNSAWKAAGGQNLQIRQAYRPQAYGDYLRSVYEAYFLVQGWDHTKGQYCDNYQHMNSSVVANITQTQKDQLREKARAHEVLNQNVTPPSCDSDHARGIAIDMMPPAVAGTTYTNWIRTAEAAGLCHYIAGDQPHFGLKKYLPNGTNCQTP